MTSLERGLFRAYKVCVSFDPSLMITTTIDLNIQRKMADYTTLPSKATAKPTPFKARISDEKLSEFKQLIKLSPIGPAVFENQKQQDRKWGMTRDWLSEAKQYWTDKFDWYSLSAQIVGATID